MWELRHASSYMFYVILEDETQGFVCVRQVFYPPPALGILNAATYLVTPNLGFPVAKSSRLLQRRRGLRPWQACPPPRFD